MISIIPYKEPPLDAFSLFVVEEVYDTIKDIVPKALFVAVTGSLARGEFCKHSDIDVFVIVPKKKQDFTEKYSWVLERLITIWQWGEDELVKALENPLFAYYTFEHPLYVLKGYEYFINLKKNYYRPEVIVEKREVVLEEISRRVERWFMLFSAHYIELKDDLMFEHHIPDVLHDIKKFLYYVGTYNSFLEDKKIPISYREAFKYLDVPSFFNNLLKYEPSKDEIKECYEYLNKNLGKVLEKIPNKEKMLRVFNKLYDRPY